MLRTAALFACGLAVAVASSLVTVPLTCSGKSSEYSSSYPCSNAVADDNSDWAIRGSNGVIGSWMEVSMGSAQQVFGIRLQQRVCCYYGEGNRGITLTFDDGATENLEMARNNQIQEFWFGPRTTQKVKIAITSTYGSSTANNGFSRVQLVSKTVPLTCSGKSSEYSSSSPCSNAVADDNSDWAIRGSNGVVGSWMEVSMGSAQQVFGIKLQQRICCFLIESSRDITLTFDDGSTQTLTMSKDNTVQQFWFDRPHTTQKVKITINSTYGSSTANNGFSRVQLVNHPNPASVPKLHVNVAGSTMNSGTHASGPVSKCFDGIMEGNNWCHNNQGSDVWLRVDLGSSHYVTNYRIQNRMDCCQERAYKYEIWVGNEDGTASGLGKHCDIGPVSTSGVPVLAGACMERGRYFFIKLPGGNRILNFAEVEVFGYADKEIAPLEAGSAFKGGAYSSSSEASECFDDIKARSDNMCHSKINQQDVWLRYDLGAEHQVTSYFITNRPDNGQNGRLGTFEIWVGNNVTGAAAGGNELCTKRSDGSLFYLSGDCLGKGRYFYLMLPGSNRIINLQELEVFGQVQVLPKKINVPVSGPAARASGAGNAFKGGPYNNVSDVEKCLDHDTDTGCHSKIDQQDVWMRVDLGETYHVTGFHLDNRPGQLSRLANYRIYVGDNPDSATADGNELCLKDTTATGGAVADVDGVCHNTGRYFFVMLPGNNRIINLQEVEVYGVKEEYVPNQASHTYEPAMASQVTSSCSTQVGDYTWALAACSADPICTYVHDWGQDGLNWRTCSGLVQSGTHSVVFKKVPDVSANKIGHISELQLSGAPWRALQRCDPLTKGANSFIICMK